MSQLTVGRVILYKNRSGQERGDPRILPPLRNRPVVSSPVQKTIRVLLTLFQERVGVRTRLAEGRVFVYTVRVVGANKTGGPSS